MLRRIGVMFQYGALLNSLTVGENVALPLEMHTEADAGLVQEIVRTRLHLAALGGTEVDVVDRRAGTADDLEIRRGVDNPRRDMGF